LYLTATGLLVTAMCSGLGPWHVSHWCSTKGVRVSAYVLNMHGANELVMKVR
jgi:hypothetical protein